MKLFDVLEVYKLLESGECARVMSWPVDDHIKMIGDMFLYCSENFTTEYKFSPKDFEATWELYEPCKT